MSNDKLWTILSKKKKTVTLIVASLVVAGLVAGGAFWWWKSKISTSSSTKDDLPSPEEEIENFNPHGYSDYVLSPLADATEVEFKKELLKAIWEWSNKELTISEIEKILLKNDSEMDWKADRKLKKSNMTFKDYVEFWKVITEKYLKDIYYTLPDSQSKFEAGIKKARKKIFYLSYNCLLEHKEDGQIDWVASHKSFSENKEDKKKFQEIVDYIEKEINPHLLEHGKQFAEITNLDELNQWASTVCTNVSNVENYLLILLWKTGKEIGKKISHSIVRSQAAPIYNKKLNSNWPLVIYKAREM